jgi:hypothetical protein
MIVETSCLSSRSRDRSNSEDSSGEREKKRSRGGSSSKRRRTKSKSPSEKKSGRSKRRSSRSGSKEEANGDDHASNHSKEGSASPARRERHNSSGRDNDAEVDEEGERPVRKACRSLLNTVRLPSRNPHAVNPMRMKALEAIMKAMQVRRKSAIVAIQAMKRWTTKMAMNPITPIMRMVIKTKSKSRHFPTCLLF